MIHFLERHRRCQPACLVPQPHAQPLTRQAVAPVASPLCIGFPSSGQGLQSFAAWPAVKELATRSVRLGELVSLRSVF